MAMKQPGQKTYKTMRGREIDMEMLRKKNELVPAVGNAKVNARGDELGAGGKIVRKREDIVNDYYKSTQGAPAEPPAPKAEPDPDFPVPETASKEEDKTGPKKPRNTKAKAVKEQVPTASEMDEWEEDENGDFIKKGE